MASKNDLNKNIINEYLTNIHKVSNQEFLLMNKQIYEVLNERKANNNEKPYLELLVNYYLDTLSERVFKILVRISSNLHDSLFSVIQEKVKRYSHLPKRHSILILLSNMVHLSQSWLPKLINEKLINDFINSILKNEQDIVLLGTCTLLLTELIVTMPCTLISFLDDIFSCFSRLSSFLHKNIVMAENRSLYFYAFNSIIYRLFIRLYAIYPCNFITYLKNVYGNVHHKDNSMVFREVIEPMLSRIRFHPFLIVASKDKECDKTRWLYKEPHDILNDCNQYTLDSIESIQESEVSYNDSLIYNQDDRIIEDFINEKFLLIVKKYDQNADVIFSQLNESINKEKHSENICSLGNFPPESKNLDSICEKAQIENEKTSKSLFNDKAQRNLLAPVPISADSKLNYIQRKNANKIVCSSPFKPIKENDNFNLKADESSKQIKSTSPMLPDSRDVSSTEQFNANNENDEVDLEIVQINNFENKSKEHFLDEKENCMCVSCESKNRKLHIFSNDKDQNEASKPSEDLFDEFMFDIKDSPVYKSRIRYKSYCLPQTKQDNYFFDNTGNNVFETTSNLQRFKSCPMLYFKTDDKQINLEENVCQNACESTVQNNSNQQNKDPVASDTKNQKLKVNLILNNPDTENARKPLKETCKSVDFTKEAKSQIRRFNKYNSLNNDSIRTICDSTSSFDMNIRQKWNSSLNFSPHELLERMLFINSEFCIKELSERIKISNEPNENIPISRRNSLLNTNSNNSSFEHIPSIFTNKSEEDMPKLLAIMYNMLVFERHQRDSHVLRNRRLFKKTNEFVELKEKNCALKEQLKLQEEEIIRLKKKIDENLLSNSNAKKNLNNQIVHLQELLDESTTRCRNLEHDKISIERSFKKEIQTLNQNYHKTELELNKHLCNYINKNADLAQLEKENTDLRSQLFLFGEFYSKIRDSYLKSKSHTDTKNDLLINSLECENTELNDKLINAVSQLEFYKNKCSTLELQLKLDESKMKSSLEIDNVKYLKDCLKMKDDQVEVLRSLIVNLESHIEKLNAEMKLKEHTDTKEAFSSIPNTEVDNEVRMALESSSQRG